jgi:2-methylcitrate dehydratase PrpD
MSLLEKPFITPDRALENQQPINFNHMKSFDKTDKVDVKNGNAKSYCILWVPAEAHQAGQSIEWRYADKACRDSDYNALLAKISVPLGS